MKSKRTKALEISKKTKLRVWIRQKGKSIISNTPISISECCCHFIPRSLGGLGIEENIIGLTYKEHMIFDNNLIGSHKEESELYRKIATEHLKANYQDWNESNLFYKKYGKQN